MWLAMDSVCSTIYASYIVYTVYTKYKDILGFNLDNYFFSSQRCIRKLLGKALGIISTED